jgi:hypothetical protein
LERAGSSWDGIRAEKFCKAVRSRNRRQDSRLHPSSAQRKKHSHETADGLPVHSFATLMEDLGSRARVTYALKPQKSEEKTNLTFQQVPEPTPLQARASELIRMFPVTAR